MMYQKSQRKMFVFCQVWMVVLVVSVAAGPPSLPTKRQGVFGPCQGWGAGCGPNYRPSSSATPGRSEAQASRRTRVKNVALLPGASYLFSSGGSWKPIGKRLAPWLTSSQGSWAPMKRSTRHAIAVTGSSDLGSKRTAWFTDIPYLRNPLISFPKFHKPKGSQDFMRRYPLTYRSTYQSHGPESKILHM